MNTLYFQLSNSVGASPVSPPVPPCVQFSGEGRRMWTDKAVKHGVGRVLRFESKKVRTPESLSAPRFTLFESDEREGAG